MDNKDFHLDCYLNRNDEDWDILCNLKAWSSKALEVFKQKKLGFVSLEHDKDIIRKLQKDYPNIPDNTAILTFIQRYDINSKDTFFKGIGMKIICSLLSTIYKELNVEYIFLIATSDHLRKNKLIEFYKRFNFKSIDPNHPNYLIASMENFKKGCLIERPDSNIPINLISDL